MRLTKIYVGSNNTTGELELDKIYSVLDRWQDSYTIILAKGSWQGKHEDTAIIEIYGKYNLGIIPCLKQELKQASILVSMQIVEVHNHE